MDIKLKPLSMSKSTLTRTFPGPVAVCGNPIPRERSCYYPTGVDSKLFHTSPIGTPYVRRTAPGVSPSLRLQNSAPGSQADLSPIGSRLFAQPGSWQWSLTFGLYRLSNACTV